MGLQNPYYDDEGDETKCVHCNNELIDSVGIGYIDRGYCTSVCEAIALRNHLKSIGAFTDEHGLDAGVNLAIAREMHSRK